MTLSKLFDIYGWVAFIVGSGLWLASLAMVRGLL